MMMDKDFITLEESKDQLIGKVGTPERDKYEEELRRLLHIHFAFHLNHIIG